jgi:hypothetical protein
MGNKSSSDINTADEAPVKCIITIGRISLVPLDNSIQKRLGITDETAFTQEITPDGILLRPIRNVSEYFQSTDKNNK